MTDQKNIKVPPETHELLRKRAKALGMKQFVLADALLLHGLELCDLELQKAVVNSQLKRPTDDTTQEG
jgi:hypothetical protein